MDRFIDLKNYHKQRQCSHLKSNMDRFIGVSEIISTLDTRFKIQYGQIYRLWVWAKPTNTFCLKSNMDRFIGISENDFLLWYDSLKSNMDRFIVNICLNS